MKIDVTQEHIDSGIRSDCTLCPIAIALFPIFPTSYIEADDYCIEIEGVRYHSPDSVADFIHDFDDYQPVKPFSFLLEKILDNPE